MSNQDWEKEFDEHFISCDGCHNLDEHLDRAELKALVRSETQKARVEGFNSGFKEAYKKLNKSIDCGDCCHWFELEEECDEQNTSKWDDKKKIFTCCKFESLLVKDRRQ